MDALPPMPPAIIVPMKANHECIAMAAAYYAVSPDVLVAIRLQEGGTVGKASVNRNGSKDRGPFQVNTIHATHFASHGISQDMIQSDECTNTFAGAFILARELAKVSPTGRVTPQIPAPLVWKAIGNYHSATPKHHFVYRAAILKRLQRLDARHQPYLRYLRERTTLYAATFTEAAAQAVMAQRERR